MTDEILTHDVFLSHSSKDKAVVRELVARVWLDTKHRFLSLQLAAVSPNGAMASSPRLALGDYLGFTNESEKNPNGVATQTGLVPPQPCWGWKCLSSRCLRVASPTRQPRALGRSSVGAGDERTANEP
jgi:hypothetical protein